MDRNVEIVDDVLKFSAELVNCRLLFLKFGLICKNDNPCVLKVKGTKFRRNTFTEKLPVTGINREFLATGSFY